MTEACQKASRNFMQLWWRARGLQQTTTWSTAMACAAEEWTNDILATRGCVWQLTLCSFSPCIRAQTRFRASNKSAGTLQGTELDNRCRHVHHVKVCSKEMWRAAYSDAIHTLISFIVHQIFACSLHSHGSRIKCEHYKANISQFLADKYTMLEFALRMFDVLYLPLPFVPSYIAVFVRYLPYCGFHTISCSMDG